MKPGIPATKLAQTILKERIEPLLPVDGKFGAASIAAAEKFVPIFIDLRADRWIAAVIQTEGKWSKLETGEIDAFYGPQTDWVASELIRRREGGAVIHRPDEIHQIPPYGRPKCWSPTDAQWRAKYGAEGTQQVKARSPYTLVLDWDLDTKLDGFQCHTLVQRDIEVALGRILNFYGEARIEKLGLNRFGGCLNVRKKRGGTTMSAHSWGTAIDFFPSMNELRWGRDRALFAKPEYDAWFEIWEKAGFISLGLCYNFDWMHVQKNP
jgi:hypothetical protein